VWGDTVVSDDTVTRTLAEVRRALRDDARTPRVIETVHRRGFRFVARIQKSETDARSSLSPAMQAREPRTIVGREAELGRLWAYFRQATAGHRQIVVIHGEAGIGKSTLVNEFLHSVAAADDSVLIGYGQCVEQFGEREPYMPALEGLERLSHGKGRNAVVSALRSLAPSWLAQLPALQGPTDAERREPLRADTPHRMLREFSGLMEAISSDHPIILVLEDLHWSDQATVDLVSVLAQRSEHARLMLIGTHRPAQSAALDHPIHRVLTLLRARGRCAELGLEYLSRREVATYLERRFQASCIDDDVVTAIHGHTDGNPLFMTVLVDHLLARGWLAEEGNVWRLTVDRGWIEQDVPENLRQLIEEQLSLASPEEREVLEVASIAGVAFDAPAVAVALDGSPYAVESICHRLCRARRWLSELGNRRWPDGVIASRYAFQHVLYQRTLYERVSPGRRAVLHDQIGRRLETAYAGRTVEVAAELARHFQGSRDQLRALIYLEQGAMQAYERRAYRDMISCLDPALSLIGGLPDTPERARNELRLRQLYASVLSQTTGCTTGPLLQNLERARELSERLGQTGALFDALSALYLLRANGGQLIPAEEIGAALSHLSEQLDASAALQYHVLRGATALWLGRVAEAESQLSKALESSVSLAEAERSYGANPVVAARSYEALRRWAIGDAAAAQALNEEAMVLAEQQGKPFTVAQALVTRAIGYLLEGAWAEARAQADSVLALSEEFDFPRWRGQALVIHGRALVGEGGGTRGLAEIREGIRGLRRIGLRLGQSVLLSIYADACLEVDELQEGLAAVDAGLIHSRDTTEAFLEAELWRLRGELLLRRAPARGRSRRPQIMEAEACFEKAKAIARAQGAYMLERRACGSLRRHSSQRTAVARRA
jgi:predicted ATPase